MDELRDEMVVKAGLHLGDEFDDFRRHVGNGWGTLADILFAGVAEAEPLLAKLLAAERPKVAWPSRPPFYPLRARGGSVV